MLDKNQILEELSKMSISDITDLISMIEKKFSISSNDIKDINLNYNSNINNKEENIKTLFKIKLINVGNNKISIIKSIRSILNLGLKESKDLVESAPVTIKENISKEDALNIKGILEENGASTEIE